MRGHSWRHLIRLGLVVSILGLASGGCELSCRSDSGDSVEEVVDEVGDEAEDVAREIKKD